jgi:hypothetical protein
MEDAAPNSAAHPLPPHIPKELIFCLSFYPRLSSQESRIRLESPRTILTRASIFAW